MATIQNQTDPKEFSNYYDGQPGTGIFAIPNPRIDQFGAFQKVVEPGITYQECIQRGAFCIAFKWVARILDAADDKCSTPGAACVTACADDRCLCIDGKCR